MRGGLNDEHFDAALGFIFINNTSVESYVPSDLGSEGIAATEGLPPEVLNK